MSTERDVIGWTVIQSVTNRTDRMDVSTGIGAQALAAPTIIIVPTGEICHFLRFMWGYHVSQNQNWKKIGVFQNTFRIFLEFFLNVSGIFPHFVEIIPKFSRKIPNYTEIFPVSRIWSVQLLRKRPAHSYDCHWCLKLGMILRLSMHPMGSHRPLSLVRRSLALRLLAAHRSRSS